MVPYGQEEEVQALVVVSNIKAYIYRITAPESPRIDKWLQLLATHPLQQLAFIDNGVGYQVSNLCTCYLLYGTGFLFTNPYRRMGLVWYNSARVMHLSLLTALYGYFILIFM